MNSKKSNQEDGWMQILWQWADANHISNAEIPRNQHDLVNLTKLDLSFNKLSDLPKEIGNLVNLTKLNLSANQLNDLPKEIGNLVNLTELDLSHNQLSDLPKEIGNLVNLTELDLSDNELNDKATIIIDKLRENGCEVKIKIYEL